jgi:hypothetical protein
MDSISKRQMYTACMFPENRKEGGDAARRSLLMDYVDRNEDPLI